MDYNMGALGKYHVMEAETLEARRRHRALLEKALQNNRLSPALRDQLLWELRLAITKESSAQHAAEDEDEEERKKRKGGDSSGGGQQDGTGSSSSSGTGAGSGSGTVTGDSDSETINDDEGLSDAQIFELLVFLAEAERGDDALLSAPVDGLDQGATQALGAATLLYNEEQKAAHIEQTYTIEQEDDPHSPSAFLSSLEQHASNLGAQSLNLKVHPDAVDLFRKLGYEIQGKINSSRRIPMQRMKKTLTFNTRPLGTDHL